nr:hypothetical protein [Tanacetum cinerariifolium]
MSDLEDFTVTYTEVSSPFKNLSDIGSLGVVVYRYDRLPMYPPSLNYVPEPEHPLSPDYVPSPKHPPLPVYVPYVPEHVYPEFMSHEDDSHPEEDPNEHDEDPKEDPADYPIDRDDDDEDDESFKDDVDDEEDEEEEEEHVALADSVPPPVYRTTARMSVRSQTSIPHTSETEVSILLAIPTPLPLPLTPYSSPLPQIPSPPLPASLTHLLGYQDAMIYRTDVREVTLPPRKRLCIAIGPIFKVREGSSAPTARPTRGFRANYGYVALWMARLDVTQIER